MSMKIASIFAIVLTLFPFVLRAETCPKTIYTFDASFKEGLLEAQYSGKHRQIEPETRKFIDLAKRAFPDLGYILDLYNHEILLKLSMGEDIWLPIQDQVFEKIRVDVSPKGSFKFFCRRLGEINNKSIVLIVDYEKLPSPNLH